MKVCSKCKENKKLSEFGKNKTKKDGLQTNCKTCNQTYQKEHYLNNKEIYRNKLKDRRKSYYTWFDEIKSELACEKCGEDHPATLDFHHNDPSQKDFSLSNARRAEYSKDRVLLEIKKCMILCSNCHRKLHFHLERKI